MAKVYIVILLSTFPIFCMPTVSLAQDKINNIESDTLLAPEVFPVFVDGVLGWKKFLEQNLRADIPVDFGAPAGQYEVKVQFMVDEDGNVAAIEAVTNLGYGMEAELVRLISKSKWSPGLSGGRPIKCHMTQTVIFLVNDE
jgi:hypothetical protein